MRESICALANESEVRNEQWRRHATGCRDCREILTTAEWMTSFAAGTSPRRDIPAAGYLLFKARLQERLSAVDRASNPVNIMAIVAGVFLITATAIGVTLGRETRFGSIMIEAFWLVTTYVPVILFAAVLVAGVCGAVFYFGDLKDGKVNKF